VSEIQVFNMLDSDGGTQLELDKATVPGSLAGQWLLDV
jgi:hypothetical protein